MSGTPPKQLRKVEPFEVRDLPDLPEDSLVTEALNDVATAVAGFYYPGDRSASMIETVKFLRENPAHAEALGIGYSRPTAPMG